MASPFTLPPVGFGPGSQPDPDGELQYMAMPSGMRTYAPHIPDVDDEGAKEQSLAMLERLSEACAQTAKAGGTVDVDLAQMTAPARAALADALGQGEVQMKLRGNPAIMVQESVFAGVWLLAGVGVDRAEVGAAPRAATTRANVPHRPAIGVLAKRVDGVVNAAPIYAELMDKSRAYCAGTPAHVVNLSLLPHTPEDLNWLDEALGEGAVTVLSRGYGNCRITSTAQAHVWRVQFYNSTDQLILDTFEVTDIPEVALAAAEDLADSAARIVEVIGAIR